MSGKQLRIFFVAAFFSSATFGFSSPAGTESSAQAVAAFTGRAGQVALWPAIEKALLNIMRDFE